MWRVRGVPLAAAAQENSSTAIFRLFEALPLNTVLPIAATLLVLIFFVTSADSATVVLSILSSNGNPDSPEVYECRLGRARVRSCG